MLRSSVSRSSDSSEPNPESTPFTTDLSAKAELSTPRRRGMDARAALKPTWPITMVRTAHQLKELCSKLGNAKRFSVDTETWGPKVLSDHLCLIQISIPPTEGNAKRSGGGRQRRSGANREGATYLIDVVALEAQSSAERKGRNPLAPLARALQNPLQTKIIHHAQFERAQFQKYGIELDGVIDTKVLAKRLRPDLLSYSLQGCAYEILGKEMSKEEQTSDWMRRPLAHSQLQYAALDSEMVVHLFSKLSALERRCTVSAQSSVDLLLAKLAHTRAQQREIFTLHGAEKSAAALKEVAEQTRHTLTEILREEAAKGIVAPYRGRYGVAMYRQHQAELVNLQRLAELIPNLIPEVVRESTSKKAVAKALAELGRAQELDQLWEELQIDTGMRTAPSLTINLASEPSAAKVTPTKKAAGSAPPADLKAESKEFLMQRLYEAELGMLELVRANRVGDKLAVLAGRAARVQERILELLEGVNPDCARHEGPHGSAEFSTRPIMRVNLEFLKREHPEVAAKAISQQVSRERLVAALRAWGAEPSTAAAILSEVFVQTGVAGPVRVVIAPNYALFYRGDEQVADPEQLDSNELDGRA